MLPWDLCMLCCPGAENKVYAGCARSFEERRTTSCQTGEKKPRYDSNTIKEWRATLFNVGGIRGFDMGKLIMAMSNSFSKGCGRFSLVRLLPSAEAPRFPWQLDEPPNSRLMRLLPAAEAPRFVWRLDQCPI